MTKMTLSNLPSTLDEKSSDAAAFRAWLAPAPDRNAMDPALPILRRAVIRSLSHKQLVYATAYYVGGQTVRAIADTMGVRPSTVSRGLRRARQRMYLILGGGPE